MEFLKLSHKLHVGVENVSIVKRTMPNVPCKQLQTVHHAPRIWGVL